MSSQPIHYTSAQIAELALLETAHLQAQITSLNNESFLRVLLMREAHTCSERRADAAMQWTQKRADALNEVVMSAVRDEAETRKSNMDIKSGAECHSEDTLAETRNAVYLKGYDFKLVLLKEESLKKIEREEKESVAKIEREDRVIAATTPTLSDSVVRRD